MKKAMTLGEQVRDAQRTVNSWPSEKRSSVQLEGSGIQRKRTADSMSYTEARRPTQKRSVPPEAA